MKPAAAVAVTVALLSVVSVEAEDEMGLPVLEDEGRITNSNPAWPGEFPFTAYLRSTDDSGKNFTECAGSLIMGTAVLTAAWCVDGLTKHTVRLGSINRAGEDENVWTVVSEWALMHPQYNKSSADYNLAIIFLPEHAPLHDHDIQVVDLPISAVDNAYVGCPAIVTGWGRYNNVSGMPDVLHWADVVVVPNEYCKEALPTHAITDRQLCAVGSTPMGYGSDAGAPLLLKTGEGYMQIGVYSRIAPHSSNTPKPAVYTILDSLMEWIHETISLEQGEQMPGPIEE